MPFYCYTSSDGKKKVERFYPMAQAPKRIRLHTGIWVYRDFAREQAVASGTRRNLYPYYSDAMAVHPEQIKEASDFCQRHGCPTNFDTDGRPELRSKEHRKAHADARGFYDRNAGYSDPKGDKPVIEGE